MQDILDLFCLYVFHIKYGNELCLNSLNIDSLFFFWKGKSLYFNYKTNL